MSIRVKPSEPLPEVYGRYSRTLNEAFGPHARLTVEEHEYNPKRELRAVVICLVVAAVLLLGLACMKIK